MMRKHLESTENDTNQLFAMMQVAIVECRTKIISDPNQLVKFPKNLLVQNKVSKAVKMTQ